MEKVVNNEWHVAGMNCNSCAMTVKKVFQKEGAFDLTVDYITGSVVFKGTINDEEELLKALIELGYTSKKMDDDENLSIPSQPADSKIPLHLVLSAVVTIPLMAHMFTNNELLHNFYFQLSCASIALGIGLYQFGRSAFASLKLLAPNMDVLVILGAITSYLYSVMGYCWFNENFHNYLFFETTGSIITFILAGHYIESKALTATKAGLKSLLDLIPEKAKVLTNHVATYTAVTEIKTGNHIQISEGDKTPVDGTILSGLVVVDESHLNGESMPITKQKGDQLKSGSKIISGAAIYICQNPANKSYAQQLVKIIKQLKRDQPAIQQLGDRVTAIFVPAVIAIAICTFLANYIILENLTAAIMRAVAVMVIACPCAMGLATPTALLVGCKVANAMGVIIKSGAAIEQFANIKNIVFDKTGTVTEVALQINETIFFDKLHINALEVAGALASQSNHPLSKAIALQYYNANGHHHFTKIEEDKGIGINAFEENNTYTLGSYLTVAHHSNVVPDYDVYFSINNKVILAFSFAEKIKEDAKDCMTYFHQQNIATTLLSGDRKSKVENVANKIKFNNTLAEKKPEQKANYIKGLRVHGPSAMVGDGINDAPALISASVGISLNDGTAIARDEAKIILTKPNQLWNLAQTHHLSKFILKKIKQNLFWAFCYNIICIPLAAAGFLNPMLASLSMAFSDLIVIGNSLTIKWHQPLDAKTIKNG
ncbi:MAG: hypothetical protein RIQ89_1697 [Bacteroidota bacterium]|jgi:Cu+-exporting ATPase